MQGLNSDNCIQYFSIKNKNNNKISAFSLIELSIVLIIIGLLVAGITGGQSLIESAKIRAFINELNGYKQAVAAFYAERDRYPGDLNNDGYVGLCDTGDGCVRDKYTASSFKSPYNISNINVAIGGFIELYLSGMIDVEPKIEDNRVDNPYSKVYKDGYYRFYSYGNVADASPSDFFYKIKDASPYLNFFNDMSDYKQTKIFKSVDEKIDDGKYNGGNVRSYSMGGYNTYDEAIEGELGLRDLYYNVGVR